jgi:adenylylsulfate kinase
MEQANNIHPVFDRIVGRKAKEQILGQRAAVIWMTGLSGSGKTTLAIGLEQKLHQQGRLTQVLDGDNVRTGINRNLGFSPEDRSENIRRIAEVSKLFVSCGIITINCFVSPTRAIRQQAREIIGAGDFIEVFVDASLETCEKRDVKGLYKKARRGEIKDFTGIDAPFEKPGKADITISTETQSIEQAVEELYGKIIEKISL